MSQMTSKFEDLSIEVLLEIFDYLPTFDRFQAFFNLSKKLNDALKLTGLFVDLTSISTRTCEEVYEKIILNDHCRQIRVLKLSNELTVDLLERILGRYALEDFHQLRSLTLIKPSYSTLIRLISSFPQLKQLEHLSIDSNSFPGDFFQSALTKLPSIKNCYLPGFEIDEEFKFTSKIESLTVKVDNLTFLVNLFSTCPSLKYLHVSVKATSRTESENLPELDQISVNHLQKLKLQILEKSEIDLAEIDSFFKHFIFKQLKSFSYSCATDSCSHLDVTRWNSILSTFSTSFKQFQYFVQIRCFSFSLNDIEQCVQDLRKNLQHSLEFSLLSNDCFYIIHSSVYPHSTFDLSYKPTEIETNQKNKTTNYFEKQLKYSSVRSLIVDTDSTFDLNVIPRTIHHLHLVGEADSINFQSLIKEFSNQLVSLRIGGLSEKLPTLPKLQQLAIQTTMFNMKMIEILAKRCSNLELLTIEINSIMNFRNLLDSLRCETRLSKLKFLRVFSRDPSQTWSSWWRENEDYIKNDQYTSYQIRESFLFIWF